MEISQINFTCKTLRIRGNKKFISPDAKRDFLQNLKKTKASEIKSKDLKLERIQQALNAPKNDHNVKMALQEYLNLNYYC